MSLMNPLTKNTSAAATHARATATGGVAEDYTTLAMRNIRSLQKQVQEIGKRYQDELAHPKAAGPEEQEILREMLRQMDSVQREIDALEQSIIEHQAVEQLKKSKSVSLKIPNTGSDAASSDNVEAINGADGAPSKVKQTDDIASSNSPDTSKKSTEFDPTRLVGSIIDTKA